MRVSVSKPEQTATLVFLLLPRLEGGGSRAGEQPEEVKNDGDERKS